MCISNHFCTFKLMKNSREYFPLFCMLCVFIPVHVKMCVALAFLPAEDVKDCWLPIQATTPVNPKLTEFYNYFVSQKLDNPILDHCLLYDNCLSVAEKNAAFSQGPDSLVGSTATV